MTCTIAAYTAPGLAPADQVVPYVSLAGADDGAMVLHGRDENGVQISVRIPAYDAGNIIADLFRWRFPAKQKLLDERPLAIGLDERAGG